jgi:hypothetical protein
MTKKVRYPLDRTPTWAVWSQHLEHTLEFEPVRVVKLFKEKKLEAYLNRVAHGAEYLRDDLEAEGMPNWQAEEIIMNEAVAPPQEEPPEERSKILKWADDLIEGLSQ